MKKLIMTSALAATLAFAASPAAYALQETKPIAVDKRLRTFTYDPNEVFKFVGHYRYQSSIEFSPDEEIASVSLGDSLAWQVQPQANRIFLKPVEPDATTNMTVITSKRIYHFELYGREAEGINDEDMIFAARFYYPDADSSGDIKRYGIEKSDLPDLEENIDKYNFNYSVSGSEYITPLKIFDDGEFTYFQFKNKNAEIPAFFMVDSDGKEGVINYRMTADYVVVERVTSQFTLRHGSDIACVFNESMPLRKTPPEPKRKFFNLF